MKKIILIIIIILELFLIKIPPYIELNNLIIIEEIAVIKNNNKYTLILKEIIPIKDDKSISYKYKYYEETSTSIKKTYNKINEKNKKRLYLNKTKSLITNINTSSNILNELNIKPKTITNTKEDITELIKK